MYLSLIHKLLPAPRDESDLPDVLWIDMVEDAGQDLPIKSPNTDVFFNHYRLLDTTLEECPAEEQPMCLPRRQPTTCSPILQQALTSITHAWRRPMAI